MPHYYLLTALLFPPLSQRLRRWQPVQTALSWPTANSPCLLERRAFPWCASEPLLLRRGVSIADGEVSYHCCNDAYNSYVKNGNRPSQYRYAVITVATRSSVSSAPFVSSHNTACSYHCCNKGVVNKGVRLGKLSQYCLQLSLLQQLGFKTLAPSRVWRPFCATK